MNFLFFLFFALFHIPPLLAAQVLPPDTSAATPTNLAESLSPASPQTTFTLAVGEQQKIPLGSISSVVATNPHVLRVTIDHGHLNVVGKAPGLSTLNVNHGKKILNITVYRVKLLPVLSALRPWVALRPSLWLEIFPTALSVQGSVLKFEDWRDLQDFKRKFGESLKLDAPLSPEALHSSKIALSKILHDRGISSAQVSEANGSLELDDFSKNKDDKKTVEKLGEDWGVERTLPSHNVELRPMVEIEITIAEVKKETMRSLGLLLPGAYSATILPAGDLSSLSNQFAPITPQINAFSLEGSGRVLANPKLLCRSGETAHFVAGGEIPIKISSWQSAEVQWKKYGVILDITPFADFQNAISTQIATEISLLDTAHTVDGVPGLLTNRIETHFDLRGSKTIALSGLIKSETGRDTQGTPGLSDIPILGELFKSRDYQDRRTELVVFVTPRMISPDAADQASELKAKSFWNDDD